jgi:hypothetical protein
MNISC